MATLAGTISVKAEIAYDPPNQSSWLITATFDLDLRRSGDALWPHGGE
jgi:hypothetical protein